MIFRFAKILLLIPLSLLNAEAAHAETTLSGTSGDDSIRGTAAAEILAGGDGNDQLYGGDGEDELVRPRAAIQSVDSVAADQDIIAVTAAQFILELDPAAMDQIVDFSPEQGDTLVIDWKHKLNSPLTSTDVKLDRKGRVQVKLGNGKWVNIVGLKRADLNFRMNLEGTKAYLRFSNKF